MIDKAIEKITKEAMEIKHPMAVAIEEYLTNKCTSNAVARKLLDESKSVKGIYDQIYQKARKEAKSQFAAISDEEVYSMVDEYYDLDAASHRSSAGSAGRVDVLDLI